jgi:hypothetical protein
LKPDDRAGQHNLTATSNRELLCYFKYAVDP